MTNMFHDKIMGMKSPEEKEMERQQDYDMGEFINKPDNKNYFEKRSYDEGFPSFNNLNSGFDTEEQMKKTNFLTGNTNSNGNFSKMFENKKSSSNKDFGSFFKLNNKNNKTVNMLGTTGFKNNNYFKANNFFKQGNQKSKKVLMNNPSKKAAEFLGNTKGMFANKKFNNPLAPMNNSFKSNINNMIGKNSINIDRFSKNMMEQPENQTSMNSFTMKDFIENSEQQQSSLNNNQQKIEDIERQIDELQDIVDAPLSGDQNQRDSQKREKSIARSKIVSLRQLQRQFQEQAFREQKFNVERSDNLRREEERKEQQLMNQRQQNDARIQELELKRDLGQLSFQERKEIEKLKQRAQNRRSRDDKEVALARLEREDERADRQENIEFAKLEAQDIRADKDRQVELARIRAQARANENVFLENKIKQGQGLLGGLLGGSSGSGINAALSSSPNDGMRTQEGLQRANFLAGASPQMQPGFNNNFVDSSSRRSFSETVFDTLGTTNPQREQEVLMRQRELEQRRMQEEMMQQQSQTPQRVEVNQPVQRNVQNVQRQVDSQEERPQRTVQTSTGEVSIDQDYAEYLKNSDASYRRGPYKKD